MFKLAISNLAWDKAEDSQVIKLLHKYNISGIELAPSKIWEKPTVVSENEIGKYKNYWTKNGFQIVATTSLLYGHPELQIFEKEETRLKTYNYLVKMIQLSSLLGAQAMVFGSPKNRSTHNLPKKQLNEIAIDFFYKIGEISRKHNVYFGIEANPPIYGTDFINTTEEGIEFVKLVNHPNFSLHLDTNTMTINKEDYEYTISKAIPLAHHFHISEPGLKPIPTEETNHQAIAHALKTSEYSDWVSIEMPLSPDINNMKQIEKTISFVTDIYK